MKESTRYAKIVTWSDEDQCYIGLIPGLVIGGCHGPDEKAVFEELCEIAEEVIALHLEDGTPLPTATSGMELAEKLEEYAESRGAAPTTDTMHKVA
jgi:hypothetical protein